MGNGAKIALVGVLALMVLVVAVWDRTNEEGADPSATKPLPGAGTGGGEKASAGPKVKVVTSEPASNSTLRGAITETPGLSTYASAAGKVPAVRVRPPVAAGPSTTQPMATPAPAPQATPQPPPAPAVKKVTVKEGDTLSRIALAEYGDKKHWRKIYDANKDVVKNPDRPPVGKELVLPPLTADATTVRPSLPHGTEVGAVPAAQPRTYTVQPGDTLAKIAEKQLGSRTKWKQILDANKDKLPNEQSLKAGQQIVIPGGR